MKTLPLGLATHYASRGTTLAQCLLITRADGTVLAYTTTDRPLTVLAQVYQPGLVVSSVARSAGLAVDNLEITVTYDADFQRADFLAGRWDGALWELFETSWADPTIGSNTLGRYVTGNVQPGELSCVIELRARCAQALQQPIGQVTSRTCRARFADYPTPVPDARCRLDASDYLVTGAITAVTSQQVARDAARAEVADWFGDGVLRFTSGENVGLSQKVKAHAADGTFTFSLPFPFAIGIGDAYEVIAGCRKRLAEDCRDKFDNVLNFQGEPHLPGVDAATASPEVDAE